MGYSCTTMAALAEQAITDLVGATTSNQTPTGGFWERGRERPDGAITGTVYAPLPAGRCRRLGGYRIEPDGRISRFPGLTPEFRKRAQDLAKTRFAERFRGWREV